MVGKASRLSGTVIICRYMLLQVIGDPAARLGELLPSAVRSGHHDKRKLLQQLTVIFPGVDFQESVQPNQQVQLGFFRKDVFQMSHRVDSVGRTGPLKLHIAEGKSFTSIDRAPDHLHPVGSPGHRPPAFVRRNGGWNPVARIQWEAFFYLQGGTQMPAVDRIEGSAEQTDSHQLPQYRSGKPDRFLMAAGLIIPDRWL